MKYIGVFCSSRDVDEKYKKAAKEFANLMAENGYHLVWGGTDKGLMQVVAAGVKEKGGKIYGITLEVFRDYLRKDADEMVVAKSLGERKAAMLDKSDVIVALVGGLGTLDELTDILELKRQKHHNKPIVVLNTDNFYEGLILQFERMEKEGFNKFNLKDEVYFAKTPQEVITHIKKHIK
jgi:uncharacterized protein (TIGR00730 family)